MEEAVWVAVGVLSVIAAIAILANLFAQYRQETHGEHLDVAVQQLRRQCDQVCKAPLETMLAVTVTLPRGVALFAEGSRVCGRLDGRLYCERCGCDFVDGTLLDLTNETLFDVHDFTCAVHHGERINVTCQG